MVFRTEPDTTPDLRIRGLVADGLGGWQRGEILVQGGRIAAVGPRGATIARHSVDVGDAYLLPGMVDGHVHCRRDSGEGITTTTAAAAAGGVTTIVEMPFDHDGPIDDLDRLARKQDLVRRQAHVDVALLATVAPGDGWRLVDGMRARGVTGLKVPLFEPDPRRFPRLTRRELHEVCAAAGANDLPVCVHAETEDLAGSMVGRLLGAGDVPLADPDGGPPGGAHIGVLTALATAYHTGTRVHVCHAGRPGSVDLVRQYAAWGLDVSLEVSPHHLVDTGTAAGGGGRLGTGRSARDGLWDRLVRGDIDMISSDHAPWPLPSPTYGGAGVLGGGSGSHCGAPGVATCYPLVLAEALRRGPAAFNAAVTAMTADPARRFGLDDHKGVIARGYDADVVAFDPDAEWLIDEAALHSAAGWSPYHGVRQRGRISLVVRRGQIVYDGVLRSAPGQGALVGVR